LLAAGVISTAATGERRNVRRGLVVALAASAAHVQPRSYGLGGPSSLACHSMVSGARLALDRTRPEPLQKGDNTDARLDLEAREKWFYQAIGASPAMFRRDTRAGSLYWLGLRDASGAYLDGGDAYRLSVSLPVPGKLFWSVTVYDADTRS
jgi:hypothetical protein